MDSHQESVACRGVGTWTSRRKFCGLLSSMLAYQALARAIADDQPVPGAKYFGCLGLSSKIPTTNRLSSSSGYGTLDGTINDQSFKIATRFKFGSKLPALRFAQSGEGSENAWVSRDTIVQGTSTTVVLGVKLLEQWLFSSFDFGAESVIMVLAHELAHVYQVYFKVPESVAGRENPVRALELQADYIAGWYLGVGRHVTKDAINAAGQKLYSLGDFEGIGPISHGTGIERSSALLQGWRLAETKGDFEIDDVAGAALKFIAEMGDL